MSKVYAFLANGFEETEAITVIDLMRRGGIEVVTVSISEEKWVTGAHGINIEADELISKVDFDEADMLFLPGGIPGTPNLAANEILTNALVDFNNKGKRLAAICAAPSVLGELNILNGKKATCFPGWEDKLLGAEATGEKVVTDGNVSTGKGLGAAIDLGLEIVSIFKGKEAAVNVGKTIQYLD